MFNTRLAMFARVPLGFHKCTKWVGNKHTHTHILFLQICKDGFIFYLVGSYVKAFTCIHPFEMPKMKCKKNQMLGEKLDITYNYNLLWNKCWAKS
jgi:hypothetical protein